MQLNKLLPILLVVFFLTTASAYSSTKWSKHEVKNDFEGTSQTMVTSEYVSPDRPLDFPYDDLTASFVRICGDDSKFIIFFDKHPNLTGGERIKKTRSILNVEFPKKYDIRMKINNEDILNRSGEMDSLNGNVFAISKEHLSNRWDDKYGKTLLEDILNKKFSDITFEFRGYAGNIYLSYNFDQMLEC